jgi:YaiO family outer membrane protein
MLLQLLLGIAATQAVPMPSDSAVSRRWLASASIGFEAFARDRATWTQQQAALGRRWEAATVIGEVVRTTRFSRTDIAGAATTYARLGPGTSLYARLQVAPGSEVIARLDAAAEVERAMGGGWTAAGGYRRMSFADADVDILGAAVSRYLGDWLFQGRSQVVIGSGRTGPAFNVVPTPGQGGRGAQLLSGGAGEQPGRAGAVSRVRL